MRYGTGIEPADIRKKRVSYRLLVDTGVATKIRRWHSLPWTFGGEETQLDNRSKNVRGLREGEREWVAASTGEESTTEQTRSVGDWDTTETTVESTDDRSVITQGDWTPSGDVDDTEAPLTEGDWTPSGKASEPTQAAETDGGGSAVAAESAWRERSDSEPVTGIDGVTDEVASLLADTGITSIRRLATSDPEQVADLLDIETDRVEQWHTAAVDLARHRQINYRSSNAASSVIRLSKALISLLAISTASISRTRLTKAYIYLITGLRNR